MTLQERRLIEAQEKAHIELTELKYKEGYLDALHIAMGLLTDFVVDMNTLNVEGEFNPVMNLFLPRLNALSTTYYNAIDELEERVS